MSKWHWIWIIIVGYLLGYYFRQAGDFTVGKLFASKAQ